MKRAAVGSTGGGSDFCGAWQLGWCATCVKAKRGNPVELGLLARILLRLLALLVALVEHFDLLQLLECLTEGGLGIIELDTQLVGRVLEVLATRRRCFRIGWIGKMSGVVD